MILNDNTIANDNGIIIAPAGCGKTETIINIIKKHNSNKKVLVLTHTNAGVENVEERLKKKGISLSLCNVYTIASFCLKYVNSFKVCSQISDDSFDSIYNGMNKLLDNKHIKKVLTNTYSLMLVDEYQDCSLLQHEIIKKVSKIMNYKLFGDSLQKIYDFSDKCVDINSIMNKDFPFLGNLDYPWRWENNKKLGNWIMDHRKKLENNTSSYKFQSSLPTVEYIEFNDYIELRKIAYKLLNYNGSNVILFNIENQAQSFCKTLSGKYYYQEEVECKSLKNIINNIDNFNYSNVIKDFILICQNSFTNFKTLYSNILNKIEKNDFDFSRILINKDEAQLLVSLNNDFKMTNLLLLMNKIESNPEIKIYRKELWNVLKEIIKELVINNNKKAIEILLNIRNSRNYNKKFKYKNLVSRILLVKGLEFENVLLVNPNELSKELLYVAISRPTKHLIIAQKK